MITPESLESNFVNFGADVPRVYRHVSFVVIDEMHSFLGNERGVHLRSLLARLSSITAIKSRIIGLSATLAEPREAALYIEPENPDNVTALEAKGATRDVKFGVKTYLDCGTGDEGIGMTEATVRESRGGIGAWISGCCFRLEGGLWRDLRRSWRGRAPGR